MLRPRVRRQYSRILPAVGQGGGLLAVGRDPHLQLHVHDGAAVHNRGHGLQRAGVRHGADAADRALLPGGAGRVGGGRGRGRRRRRRRGRRGAALEGAAARAAAAAGARRAPARLAPPVRARRHRALAGARARGGLRRARGRVRRARRHRRQLRLLPRLRQLGAALGAREGGVRERLEHADHAPAAHQPGGAARRGPAGAGGADADAGAQPRPHAGRPVRARHRDAARRRLGAVPRVPERRAVRPAGVPVRAPGRRGAGERAAVRGVAGGRLQPRLQQHTRGVGLRGQAGARVPAGGALPARGAGARRPPAPRARAARAGLQQRLPPAVRRVLRAPQPAVRRRRAPGGAVGVQPGARHHIHRAGLPVRGRAGAVPAAGHEGLPLPDRHLAQLLAGEQTGARAAAARAGAAGAVRGAGDGGRAAAHLGGRADAGAAARRGAARGRAARAGARVAERRAGGARGAARAARRAARGAAGVRAARARQPRGAGLAARGPRAAAAGLGGAGRGGAGARAGAGGRGGRARGARRGRLHRAPAAARHAGARGAARHARVLRGQRRRAPGAAPRHRRLPAAALAPDGCRRIRGTLGLFRCGRGRPVTRAHFCPRDDATAPRRGG